jgi:vanillate O-demethylase monooxygenase subunit
MYPLKEGHFAPREQWYIAAWSKDVTREPIERWILDEPVALYRTRAGQIVALEGRCPHRHFPLGKSRVVEDNIQCGYHGLTYAPDGTCVRVPAQKSIPRGCRVRAYSTVEKWNWIWIWPGSKAPDWDLLPDHDSLGLPRKGFQIDGDSYHEVPGRYMLMHDNLLDLTHLPYLHQTSIASGDFDEAVEVRNCGETWLSSDFTFKDIPCPPFYAELFGYHGQIDRQSGLKFHLPCLHAGYDRYWRAGELGRAAATPLGQLSIFHAITPATKHTAHYFFALGRNFKQTDHELGAILMRGIDDVIDEDMSATREIEAMISRVASLPPEILLKTDRSCVHGRRLFDQLIEKERQCAAPRAGSTQ